MEELTVHCMVRNEPFVYYAVKSVYDYVGKILLYDTGSYDTYTWRDIERLIEEDMDNKIVYERISIEVDETKWTLGNRKQLVLLSKGKKGKWWVREKMIENTNSKFFIILDGDEVYHEASMEAFQSCAMNWPDGKICGFVPLTWFFDIEHVFNETMSGRIFLTDEIGMRHSSPGEMHTQKLTGKKIRIDDDFSFCVKNVTPYAHFEKFLKPWRRRVSEDKIQEFTGQLPEVMQKDMSFVKRFLNECAN